MCSQGQGLHNFISISIGDKYIHHSHPRDNHNQQQHSTTLASVIKSIQICDDRHISCKYQCHKC